MNILDENINESQRQLLRSWRIRVRQIGVDSSRKGIQDDEIIPFLLTRLRPTLFTRDMGFYHRKFCHTRYCIVCLGVSRYEVAVFVRRVLRHPDFDTQAKRMGRVIRVSAAGLHVWRLHAEQEVFVPWKP